MPMETEISIKSCPIDLILSFCALLLFRPFNCSKKRKSIIRQMSHYTSHWLNQFAISPCSILVNKRYRRKQARVSSLQRFCLQFMDIKSLPPAVLTLLSALYVLKFSTAVKNKIFALFCWFFIIILVLGKFCNQAKFSKTSALVM